MFMHRRYVLARQEKRKWRFDFVQDMAGYEKGNIKHKNGKLYK
jgi:hypothetical protein